jgi:hypothetical protein
VGRRVYLGGRFAVPADPPSESRRIGSGPGGSVAVLGPGPVPRLLIGPTSGLERWLSLPQPARTSSGAPSVFLVGDSILVASERVVRLSLSNWRVTFDAVVGRSTAGGISAVSRRGAELGDAAVIELGTNDKTPRRFARRAAHLLRLVADTPVVVWVTVHGPDPPVPPVNGEIRALAGQFPNAAVADWDRAVPSDGLQADGIHPNRIGKAALARLLERVLDPWRAAVFGRGDRACERDARTLAREVIS